VISADIAKIAQAMPGNRVRFRQVNEDEASAALREYERAIGDIRCLLQDTDH
jgi:allophanate hydrolase subunit 2